MSIEEARERLHLSTPTWTLNSAKACDRLILEVEAEMACETFGMEGWHSRFRTDNEVRRRQIGCDDPLCRSCTARQKLTAVPVG